MDAVKDWLNSSLKEITHNTFRDVVKVDLSVKPMDDGQVVIISDINRVHIDLETANGEKRSLEAVAKMEPTSETGRALALQCNVFQTETNMYSHILKSMEKLMLEINDKDLLWPECYHCSDNKFLLQDLCIDDYRVVPTFNFLDTDHVLLVMKGVGKLHGLSMVLNQRHILDKDKLSVCILERKLPFVANIHKTYITNFSNNIKDKWSPEWSRAADGLLKLVSDPSETMFEMCQKVNKEWLVMSHGDFTMRNMLFHYPEGSHKPDKLKFVDFQMCNWSNLGMDLSSFLYSSILPEERDKHMDLYLTAYVESLSNTCRSLNFNGPCPSVEDVKKCFKQLSYLTSICSLCSIPFFMASKEEDVQGKSEEMLETIASSELTNETVTKDDTFFKDENLIPVMQYEIRRLIDEKIIDA